MNEKNPIYKREHFQMIDSTMVYAKASRTAQENLIVSADMQSGGMGTKGRSFSSNIGGVYLTVLTFHQDFLASQAFTIMQGAAAAVCETLVAFGMQPKIKWPNDVFVGGKKICGILIENALSGNKIASSLVGIGLNVNNRLPADLEEIATTIQAQTGQTYSVERVRETLIGFLSQEHIHTRYATYLGWMGERAELIVGEDRLPVTLLSVDEQGGLLVEWQGQRKKYSAVEVSIRF